jgi:hypothetical protein
MTFFVKLDGKDNAEVAQVGGKGLSLNLLPREGFAIPETYCLTSNAYKEFISENNLDSRIQLELSRKDIADCCGKFALNHGKFPARVEVAFPRQQFSTGYLATKKAAILLTL